MQRRRAFLFDMDGVIVNSEQEWHPVWEDFAEDLYGRDIVSKLEDTIGMSLDGEYEMAVKAGFTMDKKTYLQRYDEAALSIYEKTTITEGLEELLTTLKEMDFSLGIVSSSRKSWIEAVLAKMPYKGYFDYVLSLNEKGLPSKPAPDGYKKAMEDLGATPKATFILEDSNAGIIAGKTSGAFTIAFTQLLVPGYKQISADAKASSYAEVLEIVRENSR